MSIAVINWYSAFKRGHIDSPKKIAETAIVIGAKTFTYAYMYPIFLPRVMYHGMFNHRKFDLHRVPQSVVQLDLFKKNDDGSTNVVNVHIDYPLDDDQ